VYCHKVRTQLQLINIIIIIIFIIYNTTGMSYLKIANSIVVPAI